MIISSKRKICRIIEYFIAVYVVTTNLINVLSELDVLTMQLWVMRDTFWGPSLLVLMIVQHLLVLVNYDRVLDKFRPYIMGWSIAGIVSARSMPMNLLLIFVVGCLILDRIQKTYDVRKLMRCALNAAIGVEIYSVIMAVSALEQGKTIKEFGAAYSILPDCLLVVAILMQWYLESGKKIEWKYFPKKEKVLCVGGYAACLLAACGFLTYLVTINIGMKKIHTSTEEVYLLENCEDTSYVLTAVKNKETREYEIRFAEYTGGNNQKIRIEEGKDGLYHIEFLEPQKALQIYVNEEGNVELSLAETADIIEQKWIVEEKNARQGIYGFRQASNYSLGYDYAVDGKIGEWVTAQREGEKCSGFKRVSTLKSEFVTQNVARYYEAFRPTILMETLLTLLNGWIWIVFVLMAVVFFSIWHVRKKLGEMVAIAVSVVFVWLMAYGSAFIIVMLAMVIEIILMNLIVNDKKGLTKENEKENSFDWTSISV